MTSWKPPKMGLSIKGGFGAGSSPIRFKRSGIFPINFECWLVPKVEHPRVKWMKVPHGAPILEPPGGSTKVDQTLSP